MQTRNLAILEAISNYLAGDLHWDYSFVEKIKNQVGQDVTSSEIESVLDYVRIMLDAEIKQHQL